MPSRSTWLTILALLLLLASFTPAGAARAATLTPFQHVIIIVQENHSFDNYFGTYPTANGTLVTPITSMLPAVNGIPDGVCAPYEGGCLSPSLATTPTPTDPEEGQLNYEEDYSNNATGFAESSGPQSMVYFDYHTIPAYWDYAEEYGIGDNYFSPVLTQTNANRLMMLTGDTPVSGDQPPPPYTQYNGTLMSQLDRAGVSWGYFDWLNSNGTFTDVRVLSYIQGMPPSAVEDVQDISNLTSDLATGSGLPNVAFVSSLGDRTFDEHPSEDITTGEQWVVSIVNDVMESSYWNSTAVFITWDEGGGFYDHVIPPNEFTVDNNFTSPLHGFGQRIPLLVISPYSWESYVSGTLMSHLSLDHFIEYNWNLPALNSLVASANLPLDFFDFARTPRAPLVLGGSGTYSMAKYPLPLQPLVPSVTQTVTATMTSTVTLPPKTVTTTSDATIYESETTTVTTTATVTSGQSSSSVSVAYLAVVTVDALAFIASALLLRETARRSRGGLLRNPEG